VLRRLECLPCLRLQHGGVAFELSRDRRPDLDVIATRERDLEARVAFVGNLFEPRLDGSDPGDPGQAFALKGDELGAQGVALLEQLVRRRRAAAGGGCHGRLQVEESLRKIKGFLQ
jgi:hypothetical protein